MQYSPHFHATWEEGFFLPSLVLFDSLLGLKIFFFLNSRNIRSILKKSRVLSPVTNSVAKMMTASGGHGYRKLRSAVSLPIALTQNTVQDIQMPEPAKTASADSKRKNSLFCHYQFSPPLPSLLDVLEESVIALTNVRGLSLMGKSQKKQDTLRTALTSAKT